MDVFKLACHYLAATLGRRARGGGREKSREGGGRNQEGGGEREVNGEGRGRDGGVLSPFLLD